LGDSGIFTLDQKKRKAYHFSKYEQREGGGRRREREVERMEGGEWRVEGRGKREAEGGTKKEDLIF
jgi:hypothetical protein